MKFPTFPTSRRGFISLGCLGFIVAIALIWGGGQGLYTALKNREPLKMTFKEYEEKRPDAEWVSLSEAQLNLLNSAYTTSRLNDEIKELYISVEAVGDRSEKPALVLLETKDPGLIAQMNTLGAMKSPDDLTPDLLSALFPTRQITGLVQYGIDADSKTREKLAKLDLSLAPDFIIITDGGEPNLVVSAVMLVAGLLLLFFMLRGKKEPPAAPKPPDLPAMQ
ncbi:hypothetical protein WJU23_15660 [Prosthecobacter sp. SYSU 5D2]|uniref:hypothetical protein n=1 Tax=Prosthecobacter sp. SYSU 5D2 TaxID=3134134 RepID=UPI0031FF2E63